MISRGTYGCIGACGLRGDVRGDGDGEGVVEEHHARDLEHAAAHLQGGEGGRGVWVRGAVCHMGESRPPPTCSGGIGGRVCVLCVRGAVCLMDESHLPPTCRGGCGVWVR